MIARYDVYGAGIADCGPANPRGGGGEMSPAMDYQSLRRRSTLDYQGGYVSEHPHVGLPANVYQYQPPAGAYVQSNRIHGQSVCPSTIAYGYMNRTLMGHNTFDMNPMRH